jgi:hypothetical protein
MGLKPCTRWFPFEDSRKREDAWTGMRWLLEALIMLSDGLRETAQQR